MASPGTYRAVWGVPEEPSHGRYGHRRTTGLHGASAFSLDAFVVVTDKGQQGSRAQRIAVTMAAKTNRLAYKISPIHRESLSRSRIRPPSLLITTRRPATLSVNAAWSTCRSSLARAA